jgi:hypothetical protein
MSASPKLASFAGVYYDDPLGPSTDPEPAPTPTPRRATGIREWESWRYRDMLIDALSRGELTCRDFAIGVIVASFANRKSGGRCFPSIKAIAEKARLKVDDRGQCRVVDSGLVQRTRSKAAGADRRAASRLPFARRMLWRACRGVQAWACRIEVPASRTRARRVSHLRVPR